MASPPGQRHNSGTIHTSCQQPQSQMKMEQTLTANRSHARHELEARLLKLREDFHDASKKIYEDARRDVDEMKRRMNAEARALEEEFDREFPLFHEVEANTESDMLSRSHEDDERKAKSKTITGWDAESKAADVIGYKAKRGGHYTSGQKNGSHGHITIGIADVRDEGEEDDNDDTDDGRRAETAVNTGVENEESINGSEASTEILAPHTPTVETQIHLTAKRRHEHTGSSSSLSPPPSDSNSQPSTPSKVRLNRKHRKSSTGVTLRVGERTTRSSKPGILYNLIFSIWLTH